MKFRQSELQLIFAPLALLGAFGLVALGGHINARARESQTYPILYPTKILRLQNNRDAAYIHKLAWAPDSRRVATLKLKTAGKSLDVHGIDLWDIESDTPVWSLQTDVSSFQLAFSPDGKSLLTANRDSAELRDATNGQILKATEPTHTLLTNSNVTKRPWRTSATWKLSTRGNDWFELSGRKVTVQSRQPHSHAGQKFVEVDYLVLAKYHNGPMLQHQFRIARLLEKVVKRPVVPENSVDFVASPDRTLFFSIVARRVTAPGLPQTTATWNEMFDVRAGRSLWKVDRGATGGPFVAAISPDGALIAIMDPNTGDPESFTADIEIRYARTGDVLRKLRISGFGPFGNPRELMSFSPDGHYLATPHDDRVELWDLSDLH